MARGARLQCFPDPPALAEAAARLVIEAAQAACARRGRFSLALAGGSTPRLLYTRLAQPDLASQVNWQLVDCFWGDERCVPPDHPDSNYGMAYQTWLGRLHIPPANLHRLRGELLPSKAAAEYEAELSACFAPAALPIFDLVLLGLGADGHTASLFPGIPAVLEAEHLCVAVYVEQLSSWRLTLTPPVFNAARQVVFLVAGEEKADILRQVLEDPVQPALLPAQVIQPKTGALWLVDQAAAMRCTLTAAPASDRL